MTEESRAGKCNNGANHYVCKECAEKYRTREPYDGTYTYHNGECYICQQLKTVTAARKLFGLHVMV